MSKQPKRKITVSIPPKPKPTTPSQSQKSRPSVFERLGTKTAAPAPPPPKDYCHHWAQTGTCPFAKACKYAGTHTLTSPSKRAKSRKAGWERWDPAELADADPAALERRRAELQRELELQTKMESKARRRKRRESTTSSSETSSSESSSSSDESTSSSGSSGGARRRRAKRPRRGSSSSSGGKRAAKRAGRAKKAVRARTKSPEAVCKVRKQSLTPPLKIKATQAVVPPARVEAVRGKSAERSRERERVRTPSPKPPKEREREKGREKTKGEKEKRSPKRDLKAKKRGTPDSISSNRKASPSRSKGSGSGGSRRDVHRSPSGRDERREPAKKDDRSRPRDDPKPRAKDARDRERDRDRERRLAREEREAAREKEREEALARCQERQRERDRLKKLADDEAAAALAARARARRRDDRPGLDKPPPDRVERLLPLPPADKRRRTPPPPARPKSPPRYPRRADAAPPPTEGDGPRSRRELWEHGRFHQQQPEGDWARRDWEEAKAEEWRYQFHDDRNRRWPNLSTVRERERSRPHSSQSHRADDEAKKPLVVPLATPTPPLTQKVPLDDNKQSDSTSPMPVITVVQPQIKRLADEHTDLELSKKQCLEPSQQQVLEDDLSEISDDADEILNMDEELHEEVPPTQIVPEQVDELKKDEPQLQVDKVPPSLESPSGKLLQKEESLDDEQMDLDFEEISEDELEEELRVKGIGDALGVDWASLVAESRPRTKPNSCAKRNWEVGNVLMGLGVEEVEGEGEGDGDGEKGVEALREELGALRVAKREKGAERRALLSSVGGNCRALSARRDLMVRRHLCGLPVRDAWVEVPKRHDPELLRLAVELFERCL